ncbi:MAG: hypothetical protein ABI706_17270 [Ilumatobacteraceae bacterium]
MSPEPWLVHLYQRDQATDAKQLVPAKEFLDRLPPKVVAEFLAVLDAVAEAPPPAFFWWRQMGGNARRNGRILRGTCDRRGDESPSVLHPRAKRRRPWRVFNRRDRWSVEAEAVSGQPEGLPAGTKDAG